MVDKIVWCLSQSKGIKIIEPSERIGINYLKESETDLKALSNSSLKWKNIIGYYACYNAFYGILQKIGIKCEIHDCSLELLDLIIELKDYKEFIKNLKKIRIDVQYYLKEPKELEESKVVDFVLECKNIFNKLSFDEINLIRKELIERDIK